VPARRVDGKAKGFAAFGAKAFFEAFDKAASFRRRFEHHHFVGGLDEELIVQPVDCKPVARSAWDDQTFRRVSVFDPPFFGFVDGRFVQHDVEAVDGSAEVTHVEIPDAVDREGLGFFGFFEFCDEIPRSVEDVDHPAGRSGVRDVDVAIGIGGDRERRLKRRLRVVDTGFSRARPGVWHRIDFREDFATAGQGKRRIEGVRFGSLGGRLPRIQRHGQGTSRRKQQSELHSFPFPPK